MFDRPLHGPVPAQTATDIPKKEGAFKDTIKEIEHREAEERGTLAGPGSSHYFCSGVCGQHWRRSKRSGANVDPHERNCALCC